MMTAKSSPVWCALDDSYNDQTVVSNKATEHIKFCLLIKLFVFVLQIHLVCAHILELV